LDNSKTSQTTCEKNLRTQLRKNKIKKNEKKRLPSLFI
jgi:hypothetical protein